MRRSPGFATPPHLLLCDSLQEYEWADERDESNRTLATEIAQWGLTGLQAISKEELDTLSRSHEQHLRENSAFPISEVLAEREKVTATLNERVGHLYATPSSEVLRRLSVSLPPMRPAGAGITFAADVAAQRPRPVITPAAASGTQTTEDSGLGQGGNFADTDSEEDQ